MHVPDATDLTPRELEVLRLAADGLTNAQIAGALGVTVHAVKFHLAESYRRLGVANRTQAVVAVLASPASGRRRGVRAS